MNKRKSLWIGIALIASASCSGGTGYELDLAAGSAARLAGDMAAQRALGAELSRLFGTPQGARYLILDAWETEGFDPNRPAAGRQPALIAEAARADNEQRFEKVLAQLSAGTVPEPPKSLAKEFAAWSAAGAGEPATLSEAVRASHPSLTESAQVYQRLCITCHGPEGGGNGPGARVMNPPPRDFRTGEFVHFASEERARPDQSELLAVLHRGVSGTSMPPFKRLSTAELSGLADYVRWLSLRGRVEQRIAPLFTGGGRPTQGEVEKVLAEEFRPWREALGEAPGEDSGEDPGAEQDGAAESVE